MLRWALALLVCCASLYPLLAAGPAQPGAEATPAQEESQPDSRFVFHEVDEGIMRFDTRLGEVSLCSRQSMGWTCRIVPDERSALDAEIARLQKENAELRNAVAALGARAEPSAGPPGREAAPQPPRPTEPIPQHQQPQPPQHEAAPAEPRRLPDAAEIARARTIVAAIWRRLVEMMAHLREDLREKG